MNPYPLLRNLLFRLDPETAHDWTLRAMRPGIPSPICRLLGAGASDRPVEVMGLTFPNRVGLAAADNVEGFYRAYGYEPTKILLQDPEDLATPTARI
jgi:dihydroorotate dehydrogenase